MNKVYIVARENGAQLVKPFEIGRDIELIKKSLYDSLKGRNDILAYIQSSEGKTLARIDGD